MKKFNVPCALLALLIIFGILTASEPILVHKVLANSNITVTTDKQSYLFGDTIVISGAVKTIQGNVVTIQILDPYSNLIQAGQSTVSQDGSYTSAIEIAGSEWKTGGTYTIQVQYGSTAQAQTTFAYTATTAPTGGTFQVQIPSPQQTFAVPYAISGGSVSKMSANPSSLTLTITIQSNNYGAITLLLPRSLLDDKNSDGTDGSFIILIDGTEIKPQKEQVTPSNRTLTIQFLQGDQEIQIIGTSMGSQNSSVNSNFSQQSSMTITNMTNQTIPEFPFTLPILVIGIISLIVLYKSSSSIFRFLI